MKMGKEILTFGNIEIEKTKVYWHKSENFLGKYQYLARCIQVNKTLSTLLTICIMIIS